MSEKPPYRDKFPCAGCGCGYLDCMSYAAHGMKCCADCDGHPERFTVGFTEDEIAAMQPVAAPVSSVGEPGGQQQ